MRGRMAVEELDGEAPEYAAARGYQGEEPPGSTSLSSTSPARAWPGPSRAGLLDFQARSPGALARQ